MKSTGIYIKANSASKTAALFLAVLLAAALACGCGAGAADEPVKDTEPVILPTPAPSPLPVSGGLIRMPMPGNADILDPLRVNTQEMQYFFSLIYEGLTALDNNARLVPCIAENWSCDETGRIWTFKLRSSARWHDTGESVKASDAVQSYERILSIIAGGESCFYSYAASLVESMEALDESTLVITMNQPGLSPLVAMYFPIMRDGAASTGKPVGTGPYKTALVTNDLVVLDANGNWWKQRPYIDRVSFYARDNNEISIASYTAGQLDLVATSSVSVGRYREEGVTKIIDYLTQTAETLIINYNNPHVADINVRRAIAHAINRGRIITNVYMNRAQACDVPIAPDSWLYESKSKVYEYSESLAVSLLSQAGWDDIDGDGFVEKDGSRSQELKLRLLVNESADATRRSAADMIAAQLGAIGIQVEIITAPYSLEQDENAYMNMLAKGEFDIALAGFNLPRNGDIRPYISQNGARNYGRYSNAALIQLAENMLAARDEADYRDAASTLQLTFVQELPFIMLYFRSNSLLCSAKIGGISNVRGPDILRGIDKWYIEKDRSG